MKKLVALACTLVMVLSICVVPSFAADISITPTADISIVPFDIKDEPYYKTNTSAGVFEGTGGRYKENASKVYVKPDTSPTGKTRVKTIVNVGGIATNKTNNTNGYVVLTNNTAYAITNWCYEHGDFTTGYGVRTWLGVCPDSGSGTVGGVWSPDWSGTGTGVIVVD